MYSRRSFIRSAVVLGSASLLIGVIGCSNGQTLSNEQTSSDEQNNDVSLASLTLTQYRTPTCGCCHQYETYLSQYGIGVDVEEVADTGLIHERFNIPANMWSCHTSEVDGYFVEGHVPVEVIEQLLNERPDIDGIALPGMPAGSPGMGGTKTSPFVIYAITNGEAVVYTEH